ncbi:uncharacterized protein LOC132938780 [Metopolophium dirhodum]|uniref:uncharacterized protein LOC132938780 n=1 Tax=Metopolophium dirhodum TaxID=44670 RepID=UPI0029907A4B|nr:uncharacterized protein LOC132938780 [Metopolophium dirhodum]
MVHVTCLAHGMHRVAEEIREIHGVLQKLDSNDVVSIKEAKLLLSENSIEANLVFIHSNYGFLTSRITQLERQDISSIDSILIVKSVLNKLNDVVGEVGDAINRKLNNVLEKNTRFSILRNISNILNGEITSMDEFPEDLTGNDLIYFKYAPITSADVERCFSRNKNILSDNRRRLDVENIKKNFGGSMQQIYSFLTDNRVPLHNLGGFRFRNIIMIDPTFTCKLCGGVPGTSSEFKNSVG